MNAIAESAPIQARPVRGKRGKRGKRSTLLRFFLQHPVGAASMIIALGLIVVAVFADFIAPYDPTKQSFMYPLAPPGTAGSNGMYFLLGTDEFGQDMLSRLIFGARSALGVSISSVVIGTLIGAVIGIVSGYFKGQTDLIVQRVMDSVMAVPGLMLAMVLMSVLGVSLVNLAIVIAINQIPTTSRIVRSAVLGIREQPYIMAAQSIGVTNLGILWRHVTPNVVAPIIVTASTRIGQAIIIEGSLSFLGWGVQAPTADWGAMLNSARDYLTNDPLLTFLPSIAITIAVLAFNLAGDALRDVLDPRLQSR